MSPAIERVTFTGDNTPPAIASKKQFRFILKYLVKICTRTYFQTNVITFKECYPRHPALNNEKFNDGSTIIDK